MGARLILVNRMSRAVRYMAQMHNLNPCSHAAYSLHMIWLSYANLPVTHGADAVF